MPEEEKTLHACMVFDKSKHDAISWNALSTRLIDYGYSSHVGKCTYGFYVVVLKACRSHLCSQ